MNSKWNPQAAAIIDAIQKRLIVARQRLDEDHVNVTVSRARVGDLMSILAEAEKSGGLFNA